MKKEIILQNARGIIFAAFFLIFSLSAAAALDFGGLLTNDSAFQTYFDEKFKLDQKNSVSLWARQNFDKAGENFFIAEGNYNFEGDFEKENDDEMARQDLLKARSHTLKILHSIFCFGMLFLAIFLKFPIAEKVSWRQMITPIFFIAIGLEYLLIGIFFKLLEA